MRLTIEVDTSNSTRPLSHEELALVLVRFADKIGANEPMDGPIFDYAEQVIGRFTFVP